MIAIQYTEVALELREAINIALSILTLVLCFLFARFTIIEIMEKGYRNVDWTVKASIGLFFLSFGEFLRSSTIAVILHTEGASGTYLSDASILMVALFCDILGALCTIRVMTPDRWGNSVWIGSLVVILAAYVVNWGLLS